LLPWHTPLGDEVPWITFKAKVWLESYLKPTMTVVEYGSGGSTVFVSKRVKKLISIEHDEGWYGKVSNVLSKERILNCRYILCEPRKKVSRDMIPYGFTSYTSTSMEYADMSFESYVKSIEQYPDEYFDLVTIDGRARLSCIFHALSKIRRGGYLMLDDSDRTEYNQAAALLADYKRTDFVGSGSYKAVLGQTSVWQVI